jgi:fatty-acyl-CoA synthase
LRALETTAPIPQNPSLTFPVLVEKLADRFGAVTALDSERGCLTYRELADKSNRYSLWALRQGLTAGSVVCLIMPNCPDYIAIWLGITRVGGIVALVNTNLKGQALAHSVNVVAPKHIIVAAELVDAVGEVLPQLVPNIQCWVHGDGDDRFARIEDQLPQSTDGRLDAFPAYQPPSLSDCALYIYTSGTTGLPKAAKVSHFRVMQWSHWFAGMMDTGPNDRMYNCLPMYHSVGGVVGTGAALVNGGTVVLRRRFSASQFWDDIVESRCTIFLYIGELCRYLVNGPPHPREADHRLRLCCGNGLRADIWEKFQQRFRIPQIVEFYAATEGNFSLYNCEGKPGAIGRIPSFLAHRFPVALIKLDVETAEPLRSNGEGFCIRCSADETGEAIGRIPAERSTHGGRFEGYTDKDASSKKILRNVFEHGDAWYRTGDLMKRDKKGYFYFVDRVGDTFRWKGENVSTAEVAETISACPGVTAAVVYGVNVPGTEGRAGMAAVVVSDNFDLETFAEYLARSLPEYARPLFLRIRNEIAMTETFKPRKLDLASEGFDPAAIADDVYFYDRSRKAFVKLDAALHQRITNRQLRF